MSKKLVFVAALLLIAGLATTAQAQWYDRPRYQTPPQQYQPPPPPPQYQPPPQQQTYPPVGQVVSTPRRHSPQGQPYFFMRGGTFGPNEETEGLAGYDSGYSLDFGFGSRLSPFFAVEGTVGTYGAKIDSNELTVVPVMVGGRFIIPGTFIEPYVGGGVGFSFASLKEVAVPPNFSGIDDSSTAVGGYVSMGVDAWINSRVALNMEGKYQMSNPSFTTKAGNKMDVDVSGWTVGLGIRFEF